MTTFTSAKALNEPTVLVEFEESPCASRRA